MVVPPVPWRRLLAAALGAATLVGAALALVAPRIGDVKKRRADEEAREAAARAAAYRRRLLAEGRPRTARVPSGAAVAVSDPAERLERRSALVRALEAAITADARERVRTGELQGRIGRTDCEPFPRTLGRGRAERDAARRRGSYRCVAVTAEIPGGGRSGPRGTTGYPFAAVASYDRGSFTWCRIRPVPGEQALPNPRTVVPVPAACAR